VSFERQVRNFEKKFEKRLRAVAKESVQQTANMANEDRGSGGRMPVDTGFLRASRAGAVGRMPMGQSKPQGDGPFRVDNSGLSAALLRWNPEKGETFYVGWTANYARFMEYRYGFLRGATELWDQTVAREARRVRQAGL
jgi:hypothetical protein